MNIDSQLWENLKDRINLHHIPFSERGSRLLVFQENDHLSIRLAERWLKLMGELTAYRERPPLIEGWCLTDQNGNTLPMKVITYPFQIDIETPIGMFHLAYVDSETLLLSLPPVVGGIKLHAHMDQAWTDRRGGVLRLSGNIRRNIAYTTNARVIENSVQPVEEGGLMVQMRWDATASGKAMLLNVTPRLGFNRWVPEPESIFKIAKSRWEDWFRAIPPVSAEYEQQYLYAWWIMRVGLLSTRYFTTREVMAPSKTYYVGSWQWDNFFHALAYRHIDSRLAQDQLRILMDHQGEDGMIPDAIHDEGVVTHLDYPVDADVTKPPLLAWAAWKLYEYDHDREFLDEIYESILKWNEWWFTKNDLDRNGLCEYQHPFSSGLDDNPIWDEGMPVESPDLNTYLFLQQETMAKMAREIGENDQVDVWMRHSEAMAERLVKRLWDPKAGVFWANHRKKAIKVLTPVSLLPLMTGSLPKRISDRLVNHLTNPNEFWLKHPVPSVALSEPKFNPQQMWRGPTWVNMNYLLIEGLTRSGYAEVAHRLRHRTLDLLSRKEDFYEYYNPLTGENPPKAAPLFGWSAALFIDLAIQDAREETEVHS